MGIRARIVVLSGLAVALAVVAAAIGSYLAVRSDLLGQIDDSLNAQGEAIQELARTEAIDGPLPRREPPGPPQAAPPEMDQGVRIQRLTPNGSIEQLPRSEGTLPVSDAERDLAAEGSGRLTTDVTVDDQRFRVLTIGAGDDGAVMLARSLDGVDRVLENLRLTLALLAVGGVALAVGLAVLVGRRVVRPIRELTETAEHISETSNLDRRINVEGRDETARLASRFNAMLDTIATHHSALERSVNSQRQLVADASHELRTPIAAIRTDIEALLSHPDLRADERTKILASADARIEDLTDLVLDVIELARDEDSAEETDQVRLDLIASDSISRLEDLAPDRQIESSLFATVIEGRPDRLYRAINNLLDNAHKYSPRERPIVIGVGDGRVVVRDYGPGIPEEDVPRLFDRFWRGSSSRHRPGSGLGLAIVKQVADTGGGAIKVENVPSGGARFELAFPAASTAQESEPEPKPAPVVR
jgi:two-component system, OmpR family, sensor histidine kinase MprB